MVRTCFTLSYKVHDLGLRKIFSYPLSLGLIYSNPSLYYIINGIIEQNKMEYLCLNDEDDGIQFQQ